MASDDVAAGDGALQTCTWPSSASRTKSSSSEPSRRSACALTPAGARVKCLARISGTSFCRALTNAETFANHVENLSDEQLNTSFVKEDYGTYRKNIEMMIEHCYYHLGQVSLIKKMILEEFSVNY